MSSSDLIQASIPPVLPRGTFTGVPGSFRGWCGTAREGGGTGGYKWVGERFGEQLLEHVPHGLESDEWLSVVWRMTHSFLEAPAVGEAAVAARNAGVEAWLSRRFPRLMTQVPRKRIASFIEGIDAAFASGEMFEDYVVDDEVRAMKVDLDDPCGGLVVVWRQFPRQRAFAAYQCTAPACRDASRAEVEKVAEREGMAVVSVGDGIAAYGVIADEPHQPE